MTQKTAILVINCGSSSVKFAVIDSKTDQAIMTGLAEKLLIDGSQLTVKYQGNKIIMPLDNQSSHLVAIEAIAKQLTEAQLTAQISAVGHRVVHGGEAFTESALITPEVLSAIEKTSGLAPLHNPANLTGIRACQSMFHDLPQVAVFDTAFHQTMPKHAYMYAIDRELYNNHGIRKYGFHGTSHFYVSRQAANMLNKDIAQTSLITVHLGNGCSVCAIENGNSVDTSLGLTPVEGLVMGTRSGDVDPGLLVYLMKQHNYSGNDIDELINKKSGLLGLSGLSNDCRTLEEALDSGNLEQANSAKLAMDVFCYRVAKYIASYTCALSHLDAIVFTGGIGENSDYVRRQVAKQLALLGVKIDNAKNQTARFGQQGEIQDSQSLIKLLVIPTNEELVIAQDAARLTH